MKKILISAAVVCAFVSITNETFAEVSADTLPSFKNGTNVDVATNGSNMNIKIQGGNQSVGTANWNSFNIGKDAAVNVEFTGHNQTSLNKVDVSGGISQIFGQFTNSSCLGCNYEQTGKVILINPNGIVFGNGANVNLNSFTASTLDGTYNNNTKELALKYNSKSKNSKGIIVEDNASIYGDKNITFASNNVNAYQGSKISTKAGNTTDVVSTSFVSPGKVKIVTSDGVNFAYYNDGGVKNISKLTSTSKVMNINLDGSITSGNIDVRNTSTNSKSELNLNNASLYAVKAEQGSDGNIWLTSNSGLNLNNSVIFSSGNINNNNEIVANGNILVQANKDITAENSILSATGNATLETAKGNINLQNSEVSALNDTILSAKKDITFDKSAIISQKNLFIDSDTGNVTGTGKYFELPFIVYDYQKNADINVSTDAAGNAPTGIEVKYPQGYTVYSHVYGNDSVNITAKKDISLNEVSVSSANTTPLTVFNGTKNISLNSTAGNIELNDVLSTSGKDLSVNAKKIVEVNNSNIDLDGNVTLNSLNDKINLKNNIIKTNQDFYATAKKDVSLNGNEINTTRAAKLGSSNYNVNLDGNNVKTGFFVATAKKNVELSNNTIDATDAAAIDSQSYGINASSNTIYTNDLMLNAKKDVSLYNNKVGANNVNVTSQSYNVNASNNDVIAHKNISVNAKKTLAADNNKVTLQYGGNININAKKKALKDNELLGYQVLY